MSLYTRGYLFFQFEILNAPICSSANGLYVYMYCQNTWLQIFLRITSTMYIIER